MKKNMCFLSTQKLVITKNLIYGEVFPVVAAQKMCGAPEQISPASVKLILAIRAASQLKECTWDRHLVHARFEPHSWQKHTHLIINTEAFGRAPLALNEINKSTVEPQ